MWCFGNMSKKKEHIHPEEQSKTSNETKPYSDHDNETHKSLDSNRTFTDEQTKAKLQEEKSKRQSVRMSVV